MKNYIRLKLVATFILLSFLSLTAQKKYYSQISKSNAYINGQSISGYVTDFDFSPKEVNRGWWKYARGIGNSQDMVDYLTLDVLFQSNKSKSDKIRLYAQATSKNAKTHFFLGTKNKTLDKQLIKIIKDFKREYYLSHNTKKINLFKKNSKTLSKKYIKGDEQANHALYSKLNENVDKIKLQIQNMRTIEETKLEVN